MPVGGDFMERVGDAFIYPVDLKGKANAFVEKCLDGYTVYVDINAPKEKQIKACEKELKHINDNDYEKHDVQQIEIENHREA